MSTCSDSNPLRRDGLSQAQRRLPALDPTFVRLDERSEEELFAFAAQYARAVGLCFFSPSHPTGDPSVWPALMQAPDGQTLAQLQARSDNPPHLALFLAFLKLFGLAQDQLNTFTQRHLDYYYHEVLRLHGRPAVPDQVHLTFELARNVAEQVLPAGTGFDAGQDEAGRALTYQAAAARVLNRTGLAQLRSVYSPPAPAAAGTIFAAPNTATTDGMAEPLPADDLSWNAFAPVATEAQGTISWPEAELGFVLAAPVLLLAEGRRTISVTLQAVAQSDPKASGSFPLQVQLSGPAGWLEAQGDNGQTPQLSGPVGGAYTFSVTLPASEKQPVVGYNPAVLDGGYATTAPVLRVLLDNTADYERLRDVSLQSVKIDVRVEGLQKTLVVDNDLGQLNPEKPFLAFGPTPTVGSKLYVDCPEVANKSLSSVTVRVGSWQGKPTNWGSHYEAYVLGTPRLKTEAGVTVMVSVRNRTLTPSASVGLFSNLQSGLRLTNPMATGQPAVSVVGAATAASSTSTSTKMAGKMASVDAQRAGIVAAAIEQSVPTPAPAPTPTLAVGERLLTFELLNDLGQSVYPALLTTNILAQATKPAKPIPNPPYAPLAQGLELGYTASSGVVLLDGSEGTLAQRPVQLFHQGPFGQAEEHVLLKKDLTFLDPKARGTAYLLPRQARGGTFLLGLRDVGPRETVAVLFQVAEGSANPLYPPGRLAWSVLCHNQWYPLSGLLTPVDYTDSLQTSGIIEFSLPAETRLDNTLLDSGLVWLKAELQLADSPVSAPVAAPADSVARLVGVHPQALRARFVDDANAPAHYAHSLPAGSIEKLRQGLPGVKGVQQPYPSFGGRPAESDAAFYTRVSERLRHKQRAVTIWDYEHLVLEHFPNLYKVRCLNHTRPDDGRLLELAPGHVTLVLVPSLRQAYAATPLAPRVDPRTLAAVQAFAQRHASAQVQVHVINPSYEAVQVSGEVGLRPGYPFASYQHRLVQDLRAFLSPWAYQRTAELSFGGTLSKSTILALIEQLPYVDFVNNVRLHVLGDSTAADPDTVTASSAQAVLVSAPTHPFTEYQAAGPAARAQVKWLSADTRSLTELN